jgi:NADPH:quinone reductase
MSEARRPVSSDLLPVVLRALRVFFAPFAVKNVLESTMKAIIVERTGGPEVLELRETEPPEPGPGEARVRVEAAGVNFIDVYHRTGAYALPLPFTPGAEGAGVVDAVGPAVTDVRVGERVAYAVTPAAGRRLHGAYADLAVVAADRLVTLPDGLDARQAAAAMLQGMTAHYLARSTYAIQYGDTVLVHAAAGGVGLLLVQLAKRAGARVIGTVSTEPKARLAREAGADEAILYADQDFEAEVRRLTDGTGVQAVYDSVGRDTCERSLRCLAPRGMLVLFGQSSGPVPPVDPQLLARGGSLFLTRPSLGHYTQDRSELAWRAGEVLDALHSGELRLHIDRSFPLAEAADAHRALEGRRTTGKLLLVS